MDLSRFAVSQTKARVAILVDGDNVPQTDRSDIDVKAQRLGDPVIRRVYGDMSNRKDWALVLDYQTIHCTATAGKNRADIYLVIGALDIAHRGLATSFLIVSDDRDFAPLIAHLREIGLSAEQIGHTKPKAVGLSAPKTIKPMPQSDVDRRLHDMLGQATASVTLQQIGVRMRNGTVKAQTGKATWRAYLMAHPNLYEILGTGQQTTVRLKT